VSDELPRGWATAPVAEVIQDFQPGFASGEKNVAGGVAHLRMNNIGLVGELVLDLVRTVPEKLAKPRHDLRPGDVLVCTTNSGALVGKCAYFEGLKMPSAKKPRKLSEAEFQRVFKEVRDDIDELQLHDQILSGVVENLTRYPRLSNNSPAFFSAFYSAMRTDLIIRLGRIYDPEGKGGESCTLARCLGLIRDSPKYFTNEAIKARLSELYRTANRDYLAFHRPDLKQAGIDLDRIVQSRKRLIKLRHKLYAHKDVETVLSGKSDGFLSSHDEVRELIHLAHEIWNYYSRIWNASTHSHKTIGGDDYKWLFNHLRRGMKVKSLLDSQQLKRMRKRHERGKRS
jgi:hypothetical protein